VDVPDSLCKEQARLEPSVPLLEVVILSRDRVEFLDKCVSSILSQETGFRFSVIVSDNSVDRRPISELMRSKYPGVHYRTFSNIPGYVHLKEAIVRSQAELVMFMHDDDYLLSGFMENAVDLILNNSSLAAVGSNAFLSYNDTLSEKMMLRYDTKPILHTHSLSFLTRYLDYWQGGVVPLSSYVYRRSSLSSNMVVSPTAKNGGKYADVLFLLNVLASGHILWESRPLMVYRIHAGSDNSKFSPKDKLKLLNSLSERFNIARDSFLYLSYKAEIFQLSFNIRPSLLSFLSVCASSRRIILTKFISLVAIKRFFLSQRYRAHILNSFFASRRRS